MTEKEKEDTKHKIKNKPNDKVKNVIVITDVTQYNHDKHFHPIEKMLEQFESVNGNKFNLYVQSRYKIDQRTISSPKLRKMIVEVFQGDVVPALKNMFEEYPKVVEDPDHVITMSGPMRLHGYKTLIDKLCIMLDDESTETLQDKWDFETVAKRQEKEDAEAAKKAEAAAKKAAEKAAKAAKAGSSS